MAFTEQQLKDAANKALDAGDTAAAAKLAAEARKVGAQERAGSGFAGSAMGKTAQGKFLTGVATPFIELYQGGRQLAGRATGNQERVEDAQRDVETARAAREMAGGWGLAGEVAGFALPGGAITKGLSKVPKVAGAVGRLLPRSIGARGAAAGAAQGAGYELGRADVQGSGRLDRAATAATLGAAGGAAAPAVGRVLGGALGKPAQQVQNTLRRAQDVGERLPLTLGQMLGGRQDLAARGVRGLEEGLSALPFSPVRGAREKALESWNKATLRQAGKSSGAGVMPRKAGSEGIQVLQRRRDQLYDQALGNTPMPARAVPLARAGALVNRLPPSVAGDAQQVMANISNDFGSGNMNAERVKSALSGLRAKASAAYRAGNYDEGDAYKAMQQDLLDALRNTIGPQRSKLLDRADALHAQMVPMEEAAGMVGARRRDVAGVFTPQQLQGQILSGAPRSQAAAGTARGLKTADEASVTFGNTIPPVGPGTAEKMSASGMGTALGSLAGGALGGGAAAGGAGAVGGALALPYGLAAITSNPTVARALTGMTKAQQSQYMQQLLAALRSNAAAGAGMGAGQAISE